MNKAGIFAADIRKSVVCRLLSLLLLSVLTNVAFAQSENDSVSGDEEVTQENPQNDQGGLIRESWRKLVGVFRGVISQDTAETRDPWENWNRNVFAFNDVADRWVLTPVAKGYQWVTPDPVEKGVSNVFSNLMDINVIVNDILQFKLVQAASDSGRFLVNTTVGVGGVFDVASSIGLEKHHEDFGQTLGKWGIASGPYVVMPLLGPYTLRSGVGAFADSPFDPVGYISHVPTRNQTWALKQINARASLFAAESLITGDRYAFIRDAYLQRRDFLVNDGVLEDDFGNEDFDDLDEDLFDEELEEE